MNIKKTINNLVEGFNLSLESERAKAYRKCIAYAERELADNIVYNKFLQSAASKLRQTPVIKNIAEELAPPPDTKSKLHLTYSETSGPCLTGNSCGLKYLSDIICNLSNSKLIGEHIHLYDEEFPMYGDSYPLTIYFESDDWFEKYAKRSTEEDTKEAEEDIKERNLNIQKLVGFLVITEPPPTMPIISNKIYKILSFEPYTDQKVWSKNIRESKERMYVFSFVNDDGVKDKFAFDIDDSAIIIFDNEEYFEQIANKSS